MKNIEQRPMSAVAEEPCLRWSLLLLVLLPAIPFGVWAGANLMMRVAG
ncbi:MAG: hypothetical protein Q8M88_14820 [Phenylobacterium sp.]|nr:hypothetical protein [Phenylobacterium sp.]MDP3175703.1 hypothetical protein [Phenylobacterium sp.]